MTGLGGISATSARSSLVSFILELTLGGCKWVFVGFDLAFGNGQPCLEFPWHGDDEIDAAMGRGWVVLDGSEMNEIIAFHSGD